VPGDTVAVTVRLPARIDFAGGWSAVFDFAADEGGAVLNAATFTRNGRPAGLSRAPTVDTVRRFDGLASRHLFGDQRRQCPDR
jgi:hypothetical protein